MSLHKVGSLNRSLAGSINSSRGDSGCSSLELEVSITPFPSSFSTVFLLPYPSFHNSSIQAVAAMHELSFAVQSICVSEMLPRTGDLLFVNVTTTEGKLIPLSLLFCTFSRYHFVSLNSYFVTNYKLHPWIMWIMPFQVSHTVSN